jgi:hypothetical protein
MEEIYHREAIDEFNRTIKLKDIYEFGENDSILRVKRLSNKRRRLIEIEKNFNVLHSIY